MQPSVSEINLWMLALDANKLNDFHRALSLFNRISDNYLVLMNIALLLCRAGHHANALICLSKTISLQPSMILAHYQRGVCYYELKRYDEAYEDFEQAHHLMKGVPVMTFGEIGSDFTLRSADVLFNKGVSLICRGLEEEGRALLRAIGAFSDNPALAATSSTAFNVCRIPAGFLFTPPVSKAPQWDAMSTVSVMSTKSDIYDFSKALKRLNRSPTTTSYASSYTIAASLAKSLDEDSIIESGNGRPSRRELNRAVGRDMVAQTTEICTLPCSGIRIPHGPLTGCMAYRFVVEPYPPPKFSHSRRSIVTNFIVDPYNGDSVVPIETLAALGYRGTMSPGDSVELLVQSIPAKLSVGHPGDAGRLGREFLSSGGLTSYFDTHLVAPVLYVSGDGTGPPKRSSIFGTFSLRPGRVSFRSAVNIVMSRISVMISTLD